MEVKKPFRFSEVQNLDSNCGKNRSPQGRRKRKAIAKRSSQRTSGTVAVQSCAEVTKQIEAMNNSTGRSNANRALSVPPSTNFGLGNERLSATMKPAEQVSIPQLASCFSVDSGHGEDLSSSCESGAIDIQAAIHAKHQNYHSTDSNDEDLFEDALSDIGDRGATSDSSSTYLTPRSQSFADLSLLDDCICPADDGEMDLRPDPTGITDRVPSVRENQSVSSDSLPIARSSTPFEGIAATDTPVCAPLPQTLLPISTCSSYSPQDSAIGSPSPQSIKNSPFSFPTTSPSPPLSQTTPIGRPEEEWPDLTPILSPMPMIVELPIVPTTFELSIISQSQSTDPPVLAGLKGPPMLAGPRVDTGTPAGPRAGTGTPVLAGPRVDKWPESIVPLQSPMGPDSAMDSSASPQCVPPIDQILTHPPNTTHSLHCVWVMWFDKCAAASRNGFADYQSSLDRLSSVHCIEDFWRVYNNLQPPSRLTNASYHFFKENIRPLWEDPSNCHGGKWVVTFSGGNSFLDKVWEELLLRLISGEMSHLEDITGAVVSRRKRGDRISLWTSTQEDTKAIAVCRELVQVLLIACGVPSATTDTFIRNLADGRAGLHLAYLLHEDSLKSLKSYHLKAHINIKDHLNELLLV
ncbi:hypothetical protein EMCRGX_G034505 [Ephydatia muelleri]